MYHLRTARWESHLMAVGWASSTDQYQQLCLLELAGAQQLRRTKVGTGGLPDVHPFSI